MPSACPAGWELPSNDDYNLFDFEWGANLKYRSAEKGPENDWDPPYGKWLWYTEDATNSTGFTALSTGSRSSGYYGAGDYANFWSATESSGGYAYNLMFQEESGSSMELTGGGKDNGYSVRCVQKQE